MTNPYIGKFNPKKPIRVYGSGVSGLITAYYAKESGYKVEVHERNDQPGGLIQLEETEYGYVDTAAHTILVNQEIEELFKEIDLEPQYFPSKTKRFLVKTGQDFTGYPVSLKDFPQLIAKGFAKIPESALREDATVAEFFMPWIGEELTEQVLSTALSGIYSNGAHALHMGSIFPTAKPGDRYLSWAKRTISQMNKKLGSASFPKGMAELTIKLSEQLGSEIYYNSSPVLDDAYNNFICTNAHDAAQLLPRAASLLNDIQYQAVYKTTVFLDQPIQELDKAFGALLSEQCDFKSMGIINTSHLFPKRTLSEKLYQYSFIHKDADDYRYDLNLLQIEKIHFEKQIFWEKGIPVYSPTRFKTINQLRKRDLGSAILFGNYTDEISLRKIILAAKDFF